MLVSPFVKGVAKGHGQGVGRVQRFRLVLQVEKLCHHQLDLSFVSLAVSDYGFLDLQGGIFGERNTCLRRRKNHDTAGLSKQKRALHVGVMKDLLHHNCGGRVAGQKISQFCMNQPEPLGKRHIWRADSAVLQATTMIPLKRNDPVPRFSASRVNSDDDHAGIIREKGDERQWVASRRRTAEYSDARARMSNPGL